MNPPRSVNCGGTLTTRPPHASMVQQASCHPCFCIPHSVTKGRREDLGSWPGPRPPPLEKASNGQRSALLGVDRGGSGGEIGSFLVYIEVSGTGTLVASQPSTTRRPGEAGGRWLLGGDSERKGRSHDAQGDRRRSEAIRSAQRDAARPRGGDQKQAAPAQGSVAHRVHAGEGCRGAEHGGLRAR